MDEEILTSLEDELKNELRQVKNCNPGSDEQKQLVENIVKLYKTGLDESKQVAEQEESAAKQKLEREKAEEERIFRRKQYWWERLATFLKIGVDICGITFPLMFYAAWMKQGFKFEQTGTFTSTTFRGLFNKFRPTK